MPDNSITIPYAQAATGALKGAAGGLVQAAKDVARSLYTDFPGFLTGANFGNPFADIADALLQQLFDDGTYIPPSRLPPGFTGGNCVGLKYRVNFIGNTGQGQFSGFIDVFGPVRGISKEAFQNGQGQPALNFFLLGGVNPSTGVPERLILVFNAPPDSFYTITSVTPQFGGGDNCGNTPNRFPIITPPDVALNLNVPVTLAPNLTVNAPVTVFAPVGVLAPSFKIGDFNIDLNLGGLTLSPSFPINITPGGGTPPTPQQPQPGDKREDRDFTELLNLLVRYAKRARDCQECDSDFTFTTSGLAGGSSGRIAVPNGSTLVAAALTIVTMPSNPRKQTGRGQADVLYAGWAWFDGNLNQSERLPVDSENKLFYAPKKPSPTGFSFTLYTGFTAQAVITYKTPISPKSAP